MALTREQILARKVGGTTAEVPIGDDGVVVVRGLSRREGHIVGQLQADDTFASEAQALAFGIVDPPMTVEDVTLWLEQDEHGAVQAVVAKVQELSGNAPGQAKEYTKSVPGQRRRRNR